MSNKSRKHIWPGALVLSIAIVGVLAAFVVLGGAPAVTEAHPGGPAGSHCTGESDAYQAFHDAGTPSTHPKCADDVTPTPEPTHPPTTLPDAPASASALDIQLAYGANNMVTVSWNAVTGASGYLVQYRQCTADDCEGDLMGMVVMTTSHTITSLDTSMPHQIFVTAQAADDTVLSQSDSQLVCPSPAPREFQISALDNGARLSWEDPNDYHNSEVLGYQIERKVYLQDGSNPILQNTGDAMIEVGVDDAVTQETWDLGLSYGTTYTYRVRAHMRITNPDGSTVTGYGLWSERETVITADSGGRLEPLLAPPSAPTNLMAGASCDEQITITWAAPADFGKVPAEFPGCSTCTNLTPPHIGGTNAGIVIQPGTAQIDGYMVERMVGAGEWQVVAANTTDTSYTDTSGLMYGQTYKYRVKAMNNARLYGPSAMEMLTLDEPPAPMRPSSLVVNLEQDHNRFELQWDPPGDMTNPALWRTEADFVASEANDYRSLALSYLVERQVGDDAWVSIIQPNDDPEDDFEDYVDPTHVHMVTLPSGKTQYALRHEYSREGLMTVRTQEHRDPAIARGEAAQDVKYRVSALVKSCNHSPWNQADEVELPAAVAPGMPTGLTAMAQGQNQIGLSWTAPADNGGSAITGYTFEYSTDGGSTWSDPAATDSMTSHSHTGLTAGTTYSYRVTAMNAIDSGMASVMASATTADAPALGTPSITAASNAAGSATIALAPAANATKHFVWAFRVGGTDNAADGMWSGEAAGDATSVTMTGLTSGASYWFIAIAGRGDGDQTEWSAWSSWTAPVSIQ